MVNFMWQLGHATVASWLVKPSLNVATGVLQTWLPSVISRLWAMHINLHNAGGTPPNKLKTFRTKILPQAYSREILPEFPACRLASPQNRMSQFSKIFIHPPIQPSNLNLSLSPYLPLPHPLPLSHLSTIGSVSSANSNTLVNLRTGLPASSLHSIIYMAARQLLLTR